MRFHRQRVHRSPHRPRQLRRSIVARWRFAPGWGRAILIAPQIHRSNLCRASAQTRSATPKYPARASQAQRPKTALRDREYWAGLDPRLQYGLASQRPEVGRLAATHCAQNCGRHPNTTPDANPGRVAPSIALCHQLLAGFAHPASAQRQS